MRRPFSGSPFSVLTLLFCVDSERMDTILGIFEEKGLLVVAGARLMAYDWNYRMVHTGMTCWQGTQDQIQPLLSKSFEVNLCNVSGYQPRNEAIMR